MKTTPAQMVGAVIAILGVIEVALQRGISVERIVAAIVDLSPPA